MFIGNAGFGLLGGTNGKDAKDRRGANRVAHVAEHDSRRVRGPDGNARLQRRRDGGIQFCGRGWTAFQLKFDHVAVRGRAERCHCRNCDADGAIGRQRGGGDSGRVFGRVRSGRRRSCAKSGQAGRQHHGNERRGANRPDRGARQTNQPGFENAGLPVQRGGGQLGFQLGEGEGILQGQRHRADRGHGQRHD